MTRPYLHPELQYILDEAPKRPTLSHETLTEYRETGPTVDAAAYFPDAQAPIYHRIDGPDGPLTVYEFRPSHTPNSEVAILWLHGGGYVAGQAEDLWFGSLFAERAGVRVFSVDYRLAPEHPFPAARDDSFAALKWLAANCGTFGIDPQLIAIGGASAGGGLAAALAIHNRDQGGPAVCFQLLLYPMLDHLHDTPSGHMTAPTWPRETSLMAWKMYLGGAGARPTSVPATATAEDLKGLPPAFLTIGEADLFLDETRTYAARLASAGGAQELRTYTGVFHAAERVGYVTTIGREMTDHYVDALTAALDR